jgi:phage terminase small subunit
MRALKTDRQRAFVVALLDLGTSNATRAAQAAGFSEENRNAAKVTAHRLMHDESIQAAILEEAKRRINAGATAAVTHLLAIAENPEHKDQLKAIGMVLDRSGLHATTEHKVTVENTTESEALRRIHEKLEAMGLPVEERKSLLKKAGVVDVDFVEVTDGAETA